MKSILIIGMGRFGSHLAKKLAELGNDVMIVDKNQKNIEDLSTDFTDVNIGDCTNEHVIQALGVNNFDLCFVTIGEDFESSLIITSHLKNHGARYVVAKANQEIQVDLLRKIGADEIVYPERELAEKLAIRFNAKNIFDYIQLTGEYSIYEIPILPDWAGHSIVSLNVRKKYQVNIIAVKSGTSLNPMPGPEYVFQPSDHIVVIGRSGDVFKLSAKT